MIRVPVDALAPGARALAGDAAHYVVRVLRLRAGDEFLAFDPVARVEADARVDRLDHRGPGPLVAHVIFGDVRAAPVVARRDVTLVQGLAKGDKTDAVVRDATELGATRIVIAACARTVVRVDAERGPQKLARWRRIAAEAARQSGRGDAPVVDFLPWAEALSSATAPARFCLWERATEPLGPSLLASAAGGAALAFAAGPEGGLTDDEVELARSGGWRVASLGDVVLRTETVAAAVLGAVRVLTG